MKSRYLQVLFILTCGIIYSNTVLAESFESLVMPGKVIEGHQKLEQDCNNCHDIYDKDKQDDLCLTCHKDIRKDIKLKKGYHGKFTVVNNTECNTCHIEHRGRSADIIKLDHKTFQHQYTDFKLKGSHKKVVCNSCHEKEKKYSEAKHQCNSCHKDNDIHKGKLGKSCNNCHNEKNWSNISFDHDETKFSLTGKHEKISCNSCHINNKFKKTQKTCNSCHAIDDVHKGKNGKSCNKCHNSRNWKSLKFDHNKDTKFKLFGRHKKQSCVSCHPKNPYKVKIKKTCISCHSINDKHDRKYGDKCNNCHDTKKWKNIKFNHNKDTDYKLIGHHKKAKCSKCHKGFIYKQELSDKCISCHKLDDVHKSKNNTDCGSCHNSKDWGQGIRFDHDLTNFPLLGLHAITACNDCHLSKNYKIKSTSCISCHKKDDTHKMKLGSECQICHTPNAWKIWKFNHDKDTSFILDGSHTKVHCHECHNQAVDKKISTGQTCGGCHADDDVHNNQFGQQCERCHTTDAFNQIDMTDI